MSILGGTRDAIAKTQFATFGSHAKGSDAYHSITPDGSPSRLKGATIPRPARMGETKRLQSATVFTTAHCTIKPVTWLPDRYVLSFAVKRKPHQHQCGPCAVAHPCPVGPIRLLHQTFLRRQHVNLKRARLWVERLKGSLSVEHPITGDEVRAIRKHLAGRDDGLPWLFVSERGERHLPGMRSTTSSPQLE